MIWKKIPWWKYRIVESVSGSKPPLLACLLKFKSGADHRCMLTIQKNPQTTSLLWTRRPQNVSDYTREDKHRHKTILKSILKNRWPDLSRSWSPAGTAGTRRTEGKTDHDEPLLQKRSPTEYEEPFQLIEALLFALLRPPYMRFRSLLARLGRFVFLSVSRTTADLSYLEDLWQQKLYWLEL